MEYKVELEIHGKGNAWPVPLGETHPFYDRKNLRELSNASFSLILRNKDQIYFHLLVDAGHGTIQSLISGSNRIPDCICLTHGHMDHTLSVDWIVQSSWRRTEKQQAYPVYATRPVQEYFMKSYPHLEGLVDFRILNFGEKIHLNREEDVSLTAFPVYHGQSAFGASMFLLESAGKKILFSGDLLTPLLRGEDYELLKEVDLLVVDTNNRFPWPRTNHWSFAGDPEDPLGRSGVLREFIHGLHWDQIQKPHQLSLCSKPVRDYFRQLKSQWPLRNQPFTILEFLQKIEARMVLPVHYSGAEDVKYHQEPMLSPAHLSGWIRQVSYSVGLSCNFDFTPTGQVLEI